MMNALMGPITPGGKVSLGSCCVFMVYARQCVMFTYLCRVVVVVCANQTQIGGQ